MKSAGIADAIQFERLLSDVSAKYINLPAVEIEPAVQNDLGRLSNFLKVDRCIFFLPTGKDGSFDVHTPFNWWPEEDNDLVLSHADYVNRHPDFIRGMRYLFDRWNKGEIVAFEKLDELPAAADSSKKVLLKFGDKSLLSIPISVTGAIIGVLVITTTRRHRKWPEDLIPRLRLFGEVIANALIRKQSEETIAEAFAEITELKRKIEEDNIYLREEIKLVHNFEEIIGKSDAYHYMLFKVQQVAPTDATVLILGETGTGKELIARAIHNASIRNNRPLIKVNCAALMPSLIESELFGHEKGAFTSAGAKRTGRFELADGATLFLDEICELPLNLQSKLLRVLQEGEFERVGSSRTMKVNVRIITATNRDIEKEVEKGHFRRDLWYRLNTFPISVPPLRKRLDDLPLLVNWFVNKYSQKAGKRFKKVPAEMMKALMRYSWPGNIRELENIIERAVITSQGRILTLEVPSESSDIGDIPESGNTLSDMEKQIILKVLERKKWRIEGPFGAARQLGVNPSTLRHRMRKLGITRPRQINKENVSRKRDLNKKSSPPKVKSQ